MKIQVIITFLKCLWWNKVMGFSYLSLIALLISSCIADNPIEVIMSPFSWMLTVISVLLILLCGNGGHTISQYYATLAILDRKNESCLRRSYVDLYNEYYCNKQGIKWALYEHKRINARQGIIKPD